ncbi:hypothetical protein [Clostridium cochlearium]|uniref:hypothetical protein n=1 Tax=Clostridium cochlearium TaxID=1494 RepID=UPI000BBCDC1D|nr:hypothetical protein [Clostridium cochlearium]
MQETLNYKLKKPEQNDYVNIEDINYNADIIDTKLKETSNKMDTFKTETESHLADMTQQVEKIEKELSNYNSYSSAKDDNGIFTVVEYKRADNSLYMKSTLSNPDTEGNYQTMTWEFYDDVGTSIINTVVWDIIYDEDGDIVSKVVIA